MCYIDITKIEPTKEYMRCLVKTNQNRELEVDYYEDYGIFILDNDDEIGWIFNGEHNELVTHWKEI